MNFFASLYFSPYLFFKIYHFLCVLQKKLTGRRESNMLSISIE